MTDFLNHHGIDLIGYSAGLVMLWGMLPQTMIPLRIGMIFGNIGFIIFGILAGSTPTWLLHLILLPLNLMRLYQMQRLIREIRHASTTNQTLEALIPFMTSQKKPAGHLLFHQGDEAEYLIFIESGQILLEEIQQQCGPGDLLGEIGIFTPEQKRTCTAVCQTDCQLQILKAESLLQLYYQNPQFSLFLSRVIVKRLLDNWQREKTPMPPSLN
jgi:CRP/FNR family transcriptional regulator, cyclic AMP receptor protein